MFQLDHAPQAHNLKREREKELQKILSRTTPFLFIMIKFLINTYWTRTNQTLAQARH